MGQEMPIKPRGSPIHGYRAGAKVDDKFLSVAVSVDKLSLPAFIPGRLDDLLDPAFVFVGPVEQLRQLAEYIGGGPAVDALPSAVDVEEAVGVGAGDGAALHHFLQRHA